MSTCLDLVVTMHRVGRLHHRDILPSTLVETEPAVCYNSNAEDKRALCFSVFLTS